MTKRIYLRFFFAPVLIALLFAALLPSAGLAQTTPSAEAATETATDDLQKRLARIEERVEKRRRELGIPGLSLAIVKDGRTVFAKGFGYKNFEKRIPVTADTQFAIGSATKAFTGLSVLMSSDEGRLSLDDNPKKYIPYFRIDDPEIEKKITIRDLLTHSSGLNRTDLGWISGNLTREEIIRVAGRARPTAKLGEKFQYQNVMYLAAGEAVAKAQKKTWEAYVAQNILKPLGMLNSSVSVAEMQRARDYSLGYVYNFDTKKTRLLPTRDLGRIAPAGSINSSARDMAHWLKFVLAGGRTPDGRRLISEKSFAEWIKPHQKISPDGKVSYALGWFIQEWKGKRVVQHGGNIDGFNSMVALLPEENLGFVLLTNVSASSLGNELMSLVWETMTGEFDPAADRVTDPEEAARETGKYRLAAAGFDIEVKLEGGRLVAVVPGQPTYVLARVEGRKYKLTNAPPGFFITFRDTEAFLEQPQGNFTLPKVGAENGNPEKANNTANETDPARELIGRYKFAEGPGTVIVIREIDGKVSLVVPGQRPYPLVKKEVDLFRSPLLPDAYAVRLRRGGAEQKPVGITLVQPEGEFQLDRIEEEDPQKIYGTYKLEQPPGYEIEIRNREGKTFLQVPGQPPYELKEKERDVYFSPTIPDVLKNIEVKRDSAGRITGLVSEEPGGPYSFKRIKTEKPEISVAELFDKTIAALGGEENWRKLRTRLSRAEVEYVNQGLKGTAVSYARAPNSSASETSVTAFGRQIAKIREYFDGERGGVKTSFAPADTLAGQPLADARFNSNFYGLIGWRDSLKKAEIVRFSEIDGKKVYVVSLEPEKAAPITFYISADTFLPVRKRSISSSSTSPQKIPVVENYADYREVDGVMIPFQITYQNPAVGEVVARIKEVKHNVEIDDRMFRPAPVEN